MYERILVNALRKHHCVVFTQQPDCASARNGGEKIARPREIVNRIGGTT
jgi:hypothetical protein